MMNCNRCRNMTLVPVGLLLIILIAACSTATDSQATSCNGYPEQDIDFVIPYAPGGSFDTTVRILAPLIEDNLPNQVNVVPVNMDGAGGQRAAATIFGAQPDGYHISIMHPIALASTRYGDEQTPFKLEDFTYLARVNEDAQVVYISGTSDINTMEDLKRMSEEAPIRQALAGFSVGNPIVYAAFEIEYMPVMHNGSSEAVLSVIRGDTTAGVNVQDTVLEDLRGGSLKAILVVSNQKPSEGEPGYEQLKDVQTVEEAGHPEIGQGLQTQYVIAAPPDLPDCVRGILDDAIQGVMRDPEFVDQMREQDLTVEPLGADETQELVEKNLDFLDGYSEVLIEAREVMDQ